MNRLFLQKAINKLNEDILIKFGISNSIYLDYTEAAICINFLRNNYNEILDSKDPKAYIYSYYEDPLADKMYKLLMAASVKFKFYY